MSIAARISHRGDEYQVAVATHWLTRLLVDDSLQSVDVEVVALPGRTDVVAVDDIVVTDINGIRRFIQAKKNQTNHAKWSLADATLKEELGNATKEWTRDPSCIVEFVSQTPFGDIEKLQEQSVDYPSFAFFEKEAPATIKKPLRLFAEIVSRSQEECFSFLNRLRFGDQHKTETWQSLALEELKRSTTDPVTAFEVLKGLVLNRQTGMTHEPCFDRAALSSALDARGISIIGRSAPPDPVALREKLKQLSRELLFWPSLLPGGQWLPRPELDELQKIVREQKTSTTVLLGRPGSGKSALLATLGNQVDPDVAVLAIKADLLPESITSREALNSYLHLPIDIVTALRSLAQTTKVLLLIDQLDALADLVVQRTLRLPVLLTMVGDLHENENIHVVVSCRAFEFNHDPHLKNLELPALDLALPEWSQVQAVLEAQGIHADGWNPQIHEDFRSPHVLNLFLKLAQSNPLEDLLVSYQLMLERLWQEQVLSDNTQARRDALRSIVDDMAEREVLFVAHARHEIHSPAINGLVRAGILMNDAGRIGFVHQTLYEFALARIFISEPGRLAATVEQHQDSLRVRPQLWHALTYMRAVEPDLYDGELKKLVHSNLRAHLKNLLIEFVGQQRAPSTQEKTFLFGHFDDRWYRRRFLAAVAGRQAWFELTAPALLPQAMMGPADHAFDAFPVLEQALQFARNDVMRLIDQCWLQSKPHQRLAAHFLFCLPDWQPEDVERLCVLAKAEAINMSTIGDMVSAISLAHPEMAARPFGIWLDTLFVPTQAEPADLIEDEANEKCRRLLMGHEFYGMPAVAEAAPGPFLAAIWNWFLAVLRASTRGRALYVDRFRTANHLVADLDESEERVSQRHPLLGAILTSVECLAAADAKSFMEFFRANEQCDFMVVQRMLARGLAIAAPTHALDALRFLESNRRRFVLGSHSDPFCDTKLLIAACASNLGTAERSKLRQLIDAWDRYEDRDDDDAKTRFDRKQWNREARLGLLQAFPESTRAPEVQKQIEEEHRAMPHAASRPPIVSGGIIGSPIALSQLKLMSDENIINLFRKLPDSTGWGDPHTRGRAFEMTGGARQAGREVAALAKEEPVRGAGLAQKLDPQENAIPISDIVRALGDSSLDPETLFALIAELDSKGMSRKILGPDAGWALQTKISPEHPLPDALIELLDRWLDELAGSTAESDEDEEKPQCEEGFLWGGTDLVAVPNGSYPVLAALTAALLSTHPPSTERWLESLNRHLNRSETSTVWMAMAQHLRNLRGAPPAEATLFVRRLVDRFPQMFKHKHSVHFLASTQWWIDATTYQSWLKKGAASVDERTQLSCGELLALYSIRHPAQAWATEWVSMTCEATGIQVPVALRRGVALVISRFWNDVTVRALLHPLVLALLENPLPEMARVLGSLFDPQTFVIDNRSIELARTVIASSELIQRVNPEDFAECLLVLVERAPTEAGRAAIALMDARGEQIGSVAYAASMAADPILAIAMKLQDDPDHRTLGATLFEKVLEANVPQAHSLLIALDKRTPSATQPIRARRRGRKRRSMR